MLADRRRAHLVAHLREKGIDHERTLAAIGRVPRHKLVDRALRHRAYHDEALPIGLNQTISQPFTVATMTALLDPQPHDRILEIGTGSGYQAAVLAEMGARVFSIERHEALLERTRRLLDTLDIRVRTRLGDGTRGWTGLAPFDGIIVTAGGARVPQALFDQLRPPQSGKPDARLIIPLGAPRTQTLHRFIRTGPGPDDITDEAFMDCRFVPLVEDD